MEKEILKTFSENGANIFACVRNIDNKFKFILNLKKYKNKINPIEFDLSNEEEIVKAANEIIKQIKTSRYFNK